MLMPKTLEEVQNFKCANCKDDAMNLYTCVGCERAKAEEAFNAAEVKAYTKKPHSKKLLCLECVAQGRTIRDTELYTCALCKGSLGRTKFSLKDMSNFQQGMLKSLRCTQCKFSLAIAK